MKRLILALGALVILKELLLRGEGAKPGRDAERGKTEPHSRSGENGALSPNATPKFTAPTILPVRHILQENIYSWCYAACAQMILLAYDKPVTQCKIVSGVKEEKCCLNPDLPVCADEGCDHEDIAPIYTSRGVSAVRHQPPGTILEADLRREIAERRPVEVTLAAEGSFHAVVIRGFNDKYLFVNDPLKKPLPALGFHLKSYDELVDDGYYTWDETWLGFPPIS